jgi:hypothetical protein
MYNMLFGRNPLSPLWLTMLGLTTDDVGRFRDCFIQKTDAGDLRIVIYTRNGGGNRDDYAEVTEKLQAHKDYVTDFDDDFDCTYASYVFKVPEKFAAAAQAFADMPDQQVDPGARYKKLIDDMQAGKNDDPTVKHALEVGKKILEPIFAQLQKDKTP